jgi:hypothetical protein
MDLAAFLATWPQGVFIAGLVAYVRQQWLTGLDGKLVQLVVLGLSLGLCLLLDPKPEFHTVAFHTLLVTASALGGVALLDRHATKTGSAVSNGSIVPPPPAAPAPTATGKV